MYFVNSTVIKSSVQDIRDICFMLLLGIIVQFATILGNFFILKYLLRGSQHIYIYILLAFLLLKYQ